MTGSPESLHILLVEDDPDTARLIARRLSWADRFTVDQAPDLQTALGRIEHEDYDLVLLDLSLPDGEPMSSLAAAGALSRHIPIVILTASDDDGLAQIAARLGVQGYLVKDKSSDTRTLVRSVLAAIHRHRWVRAG